MMSLEMRAGLIKSMILIISDNSPVKRNPFPYSVSHSNAFIISLHDFSSFLPSGLIPPMPRTAGRKARKPWSYGLGRRGPPAEVRDGRTIFRGHGLIGLSVDGPAVSFSAASRPPHVSAPPAVASRPLCHLALSVPLTHRRARRGKVSVWWEYTHISLCSQEKKQINLYWRAKIHRS